MGASRDSALARSQKPLNALKTCCVSCVSCFYFERSTMSKFVTVDVIGKKRDKKELTTEEIKFVVDGFTSGAIADYQMSALLMAIVVNRMNFEKNYANFMISHHYFSSTA